jgi:hypothetical protein
MTRFNPRDAQRARDEDDGAEEASSGKRTRQAYFERLAPFAVPFMALFERGTQPHRATLSRFLAVVDDPCVDALRTLFASSSFTWGWTQATIGGLWDRTGRRSLVFDIDGTIDGTREAARQRALPHDPMLPPPSDASRPSVRLATKGDAAGR